MTRGRALGAALVACAVAFAAGTGWALECGEVAVLRTSDASGAAFETRVWVADQDGAAWIEAATPERDWYRRVLARPRVELVRDGTRRSFRAEPAPNPAGHARIRALLAEKYGLADRWVGLLQDTSQSIAVRLSPLDG